MISNRDRLVERVQIVLYVLFLFFWFISPNIPALRIASIVLLACFSLFQVLKMIRRKKIFITKPVMFYILFVFWALLSIVWAQDQSMAIDRITDLVCNALFLFISYDFFSGAKMRKKAFISIFVIVGLLFTAYVFMHYGIDRYFSMLLAGRRVGGEIINVNFVGLVSTMTIIMILYLVLNNEYKNKLVLLLLIPLLIVALGSGSKKVLIGLVIGVLTIIVLYLKGRMTWKKVATIMTFFVVLISSVFVVSKLPYFNTVFERVGVMFASFDDNASVEEGSTRARKEFMEKGLDTFLDYPVTGIGLNNSGIITDKIIGQKVYLHCNYVEILACLGIVGFLLYYAIYYMVIVKTIQSNKKTDEKNYLPLVMAIVLLVVEIGCVTYYEIKTSMYFILMIVLLYRQKWEGTKFFKPNNTVGLSDDTSKSNNKLIEMKENDD